MPTFVSCTAIVNPPTVAGTYAATGGRDRGHDLPGNERRLCRIRYGSPRGSRRVPPLAREDGGIPLPVRCSAGGEAQSHRGLLQYRRGSPGAALHGILTEAH